MAFMSWYAVAAAALPTICQYALGIPLILVLYSCDRHMIFVYHTVLICSDGMTCSMCGLSPRKNQCGHVLAVFYSPPVGRNV